MFYYPHCKYANACVHLSADCSFLRIEYAFMLLCYNCYCYAMLYYAIVLVDHLITTATIMPLLLLQQGVPHHAKAGNLNNCILKAGSTGQLIIVLDCDMLPEKCMARTVAPFFYKRTSAVLREAAETAAETAAASTASTTATASTACTASTKTSSRSSKKRGRAVHPDLESGLCDANCSNANASCSNGSASVTAVPSPQVANSSGSSGDIETGDVPTSSTDSSTGSSTSSTTADSTIASAASAAAAAAAAVAASGPVFDYSVGLLQSPQAFYNLDTHDLLGQSYTVFYECVLSGWDGAGCTPCCGTGVTFSR
jgi:hypothetical protein